VEYEEDLFKFFRMWNVEKYCIDGRDDFAAALITGFLTIVPSGMRRKTPIKTPFPRTNPVPWGRAALHYALRLNNQPPNQLTWGTWRFFWLFFVLGRALPLSTD
jgi:hypothetical protein